MLNDSVVKITNAFLGYVVDTFSSVMFLTAAILYTEIKICNKNLENGFGEIIIGN